MWHHFDPVGNFAESFGHLNTNRFALDQDAAGILGRLLREGPKASVPAVSLQFVERGAHDIGHACL